MECAVSVCGGSSSGVPSECSFLSDVLVSASQRQDDGETDQEQLDIFSSDSMSDHTETESRAGVSFYFKVRVCVCVCYCTVKDMGQKEGRNKGRKDSRQKTKRVFRKGKLKKKE